MYISFIREHLLDRTTKTTHETTHDALFSIYDSRRSCAKRRSTDAVLPIRPRKGEGNWATFEITRLIISERVRPLSAL